MSNDTQTLTPVPTQNHDPDFEPDTVQLSAPTSKKKIAKIQPITPPPATVTAPQKKVPTHHDPDFEPDEISNPSTKDAPPIPGGVMEKVKNAWKYVNTPPPSVEKNLLAPGRASTQRAYVQSVKDREAGHTTKAWWEEKAAALGQSVDELGESVITPLSVALTTVSVAENVFAESAAAFKKASPIASKFLTIPLKTGRLGLGAVNAIQGAQQAGTSRQPGESDAEYWGRVSGGTGQFLIALAGGYAEVKDAVHDTLHKQLRLSDPLAKKVNENLQKINDARTTEAKKIATAKEEHAQKNRAIDSKKVQAEGEIESQLEQNLTALNERRTGMGAQIDQDVDKGVKELEKQHGELDKQKIQFAKQLVVDTANTLGKEQARLGKEFQDIGKEVKGKITNSAALKDLVTSEITAYGVQETEIPKTIFKALPPAEEVYIDQGGSLQSLGDQGDVKFDDLTAIKNDLWDASDKTGDGRLKAALRSAAHKISDMQEAAAKKAGQGARYEAAKKDYFLMKHGVGGDTVIKWLDADQQSDQLMADEAFGQIFGKAVDITKAEENTAALFKIMRSVGLDPSPLEKTVADMKAAQKRMTEIPKEGAAQKKQLEESVSDREAYEKKRAAEEVKPIRKKAGEEKVVARQEATAKISEAKEERKQGVKAGEAKGEIVPGKTTSELAGKSNDELLRMRLQESFRDAKAAGVGRMGRMIMAIYGLADMARGRMWGAGMLAYAGSRELIPEMVKNKNFQDWLIRQSGVEPSDKLMVSKLRLGIEKLYPMLRSMVKGQAIPTMTSGLQKVPQQTAPPKALEALPDDEDTDFNPPPQP